MNEKEFSRALGEINEKYLDEAIDYRKKRNYFYLIHVAALAACLCLVLVGALEIGKKQNKSLLNKTCEEPEWKSHCCPTAVW